MLALLPFLILLFLLLYELLFLIHLPLLLHLLLLHMISLRLQLLRLLLIHLILHLILPLMLLPLLLYLPLIPGEQINLPDPLLLLLRSHSSPSLGDLSYLLFSLFLHLLGDHVSHLLPTSGIPITLYLALSILPLLLHGLVLTFSSLLSNEPPFHLMGLRIPLDPPSHDPLLFRIPVIHFPSFSSFYHMIYSILHLNPFYLRIAYIDRCSYAMLHSLMNSHHR